ncbi:MAG: ATP synthase F1 subunit gamma [Lachnospiraceae bacterium]|nr:ATP synthase F1 subunit gamma [Lachnospiraceae bacterium]
MANMKEIQNRINSVKDTMKITNAMYTISSSKMKQAKKKLEDTEPYFYAMQGEIARILRHVPDINHRYFDQRAQIAPEDRRIGTIVVTADKGMAGAYNHDVLKMADAMLERPGHHHLYILGELGRHYYASHHITISKQFHYTVQKPTMHRARNITSEVLDRFDAGKLDEVYIIYTNMETAMASEPKQVKLLPLERTDFSTMKMPLNVHREEIDLYPSADSVMDSIIPNYINGMIYGCLVESYSSEHNSRMMAMQAASDSAKTIIHDLSILYNRARQAAITQEITEVCCGARAQKQKRK